MTDRDKKDHDDTVEDEDVPARQPTDEDDERAAKDAAVDQASEQSMDGSDSPAW